jgi:hypothetical protein
MSVIETRATLGDRFIKGLSADLFDIKNQAEQAYSLAMESALGVEANKFTRLWKTPKSNAARETISGKTGVGYMQNTGEGEDYKSDSRSATYQTQFTFEKYTNSITVTEEDIEDRIVDRRLDEARDLLIGGMQTQNKHAFDVFNQGFTAQASLSEYLTFYGDGVPFFSTVHPIRVTTTSNTTQSNASATSIPLTEVNLATAKQALRRQTDDKDLPMNIGSGKLILLVPDSLENQAVIITDSKLRSNTANNDINIYDGNITVMSSKWLNSQNGGLDTQWMLIDSMKSPAWFFNRRPLSLGKPYENKTNKNVTSDISARYQVGNVDFRGAWGSQGDGSAYSS